MFKSSFTLLVASSIFLAAFVGCSEPAEQSTTVRVKTGLPEEINEAMKLQEKAWNDGDMDGFMSLAYWQNDSLMFIGSKGVTYGYDQVLNNYHTSYPDGASKGKLTFENLEWIEIGEEHGFLIGKWSIDREEPAEDISGHYSLVWKRFPEGWRIIADHSS